MKKDLIKNCFNYLFLELDGLKTTACMLFVLFVCLVNTQSLLAQHDNSPQAMALWTDAIETDELSIKYTADVANYQNGNRTFGAMYSIPNMESGYRHLGNAQTIQFSGVATMLIVKPKATKPNNPNNPNNRPPLVSPKDYVLSWVAEKSDHYGTPKGTKYSIWMPVVPEGYKALGVAVNDGEGKPSVDVMWCVRTDLTVPAKAGSLTLAINKDQCYSIAPTNLRTANSEMHLVSGSFLPHKNMLPANALKVNMQKTDYNTMARPTFTAGVEEGNTSEFQKISCSYIPTVTLQALPGFTLDQWKDRLRKSQLLQVVTYDAFKLIDLESNNTSNEVRRTFSTTVGTETERTKEIGHSFNATIEAGYSSGDSPGANVSLSLSYGFNFTETNRTTQSISTTKGEERPIGANKEVGLFQKIRKYQIYYKDASGTPQLLQQWEMVINGGFAEERNLLLVGCKTLNPSYTPKLWQNWNDTDRNGAISVIFNQLGSQYTVAQLQGKNNQELKTILNTICN